MPTVPQKGVTSSKRRDDVFGYVLRLQFTEPSIIIVNTSDTLTEEYPIRTGP